jgi:hypothetical protein
MTDEIKTFNAPEPEPLHHKHEWIRTGAMQAGQYRCISCGAWNHENFETPQPVKREWVGLDQGTVYALFYCDLDQSFTDFARAIEEALKKRNHE